MKENLKLGIILCLITSFAGVFLGFANEFTKEVIAQNAKLSADDLKEILPKANKLEDFTFEKNEDSTISVVMYGSDAYKLDFRLKDGMSVVVDGRIDVYVNRGEYQLYAKTVSQSGMGELFKQYEQLKQYYEDMGYFAPEYKRTIPKYAKRIGIVTARTGAAIKDIIKNAYERNPYVELYLYSVLVQGKDAKYSIAKGLKYVDSMGYDCIIVGRGGGSIEDLWAFNEPEVIEAVFNCKTPVISAVGHEIDFTITDFVADFRAPTPSAAAVKAVFDIRQLEVVIDGYNDRLMYDMGKTITDYRNRSERMLLSLKAFNPLVRLNNKKQQLIHMREKLDVSMQGTLNKAKHRLLLLSARLDGVSPLKKLEQGYAFVENDKEEHISSIAEVKQADVLSIHVKDGIINTVVKDVKKF